MVLNSLLDEYKTQKLIAITRVKELHLNPRIK